MMEVKLEDPDHEGRSSRKLSGLIRKIKKHMIPVSPGIWFSYYMHFVFLCKTFKNKDLKIPNCSKAKISINFYLLFPPF